MATVTLPASKFTELLSKCTAASEAASAWESAITTAPTVHTFQTYQLLAQTMTLIETAKTTVEDARKTWTAFNHNDRSVLSITLHDAVDAICDIKADEDIISAGVSAFNPNSKMGQDVTMRGSMMMKRKETDCSTEHPQRKRAYIPPGTGKKKDSICIACKKKGHWKGDFICENHQFHKQWLEKQVRFESDRTPSGNGDKYFQ